MIPLNIIDSVLKVCLSSNFNHEEVILVRRNLRQVFFEFQHVTASRGWPIPTVCLCKIEHEQPKGAVDLAFLVGRPPRKAR